MQVIVSGQRRSLVWATLDYTRFNLGVLVLGIFFLIVAEQGADVVRGLAAADPWRQTLFHLAVFAWGWQSWFWARFMLQDRLAELERKVNSGGHGPGVNFVRWYPRALGLIAMAAATVALVVNHGLLNQYVALNLATIALYLALVVGRRAVRNRYSSSAVLAGFHIITGLLATSVTRLMPRLQGDTDMPVVGPLTIAGGLAISLATAGWALVDPVDYGFAVGSAAVIFIALASMLPVGSVAVWATRERGRPILTVLFVVVAVFNFTNNNHTVRTLAGPEVAKPGPLESLEALLARHEGAGGAVPVVMVATAGGGIRAAYWTATVLAAAEDELRQRNGARFSDHLFAISGVSGGSVGAAFYTAALRDLGPDASKTAKLQQALSSDFLGPALTGLLYQDLWQSFLPWPAFEDRGAILEQAFETAWAAQAPADAAGLGAGLTTLAATEAEGPWLPRLLLNGTNNVTGQRMIAATMALRDRLGTGRTAEVIANALDQHAYLSADPAERTLDMRLSTAAHNSARFPVISTGGVWPRGGSLVVDGGYFENYGAATLLDLASHLRKRAAELRRPIRPIVIQISSDPEIGEALVDGIADPDVDGGLVDWRLWNAVSGPAGGIFGARTARGVLAANDLRRWAESVGDDDPHVRRPLWLHFKMVRSTRIEGVEACLEGMIDPPLGWVMSEQSRTAIGNMIDCVMDNRKAMNRLLDALAPLPAIPDAVPAPVAAVR